VSVAGCQWEDEVVSVSCRLSVGEEEVVSVSRQLSVEKEATRVQGIFQSSWLATGKADRFGKAELNRVFPQLATGN
jgi:hypothetical protein